MVVTVALETNKAEEQTEQTAQAFCLRYTAQEICRQEPKYIPGTPPIGLSSLRSRKSTKDIRNNHKPVG